MSANFPRMFTIRQNLPHSAPFDIPANVQNQLAQKLTARIMPGARIAVTVGSRGISNLQQIVSVVVNWLKQRGAMPFIVPAMGSHGGATPEGQADVLADYGITEEKIGAPVRASLEVKHLGSTDDGVDVYFSSEALSADGILLINRIKPHTDFSGSIGSGILKMIAIGLGKRMGAGACHTAFTLRGHEQVIRKVAGVSLRRTPILGAVAILEDQFHETANVVTLGKEEIEVQEEQLFAQARRLMPRLPIDDIDFLIIDRMGKNISGSGMDPNIIGRSVYGYTSQGPSVNSLSPVKIKRIFVRDLTAESHGNAVGIGLADLTTSRLVRAMNPQATYVNALTSMAPLIAKIPIYFETDSEAITGGLASLGISDASAARVVRIADTLSLELLQVAESYSGQLAEKGDLTVLDKPQEMKFDPHENLLPFAGDSR
jgi:hypothetical protein